MKLNLSQEANCLVIRPEVTHLDFSNVKAFRAAIASLLQPHTHVLLDMSGLEFLDSAGIGALIACQRTVKECEGGFSVCGLNRPVRTLFDLMRLHRVLEIHPDRTETSRSIAP